MSLSVKLKKKNVLVPCVIAIPFIFMSGVLGENPRTFNYIHGSRIPVLNPLPEVP